jgi:hypothetical protein
MITTVTRDTTPKHMPRQMIHDLRENVLAGVHRRPRDPNKPQRSENVRKIQVDNARKRHFTEKYQLVMLSSRNNVGTPVE